MALIHDDPKKPKKVFRIQGPDGEGPYGDSGQYGTPQSKVALPSRANPDFYQPLPEHDFDPEDMEEFHNGENGSGYYYYGFEKPEHATRWFGRDGIQALYENGYRLVEIPASKIYRSAGGYQVFFEHSPKWNGRSPDAKGFEHPTRRVKFGRTR